MITLITNLSYCTINGVRANVDAVIIEPHDPNMPSLGSSTAVRVRGFGPDPAWPIFTFVLDTEDPSYELEAAQSNNVLFMGENEDGTSKDPVPLFRGGIITFKDGTQMSLSKGTFDERPIDFSEHPGVEDHFEALWSALRHKTAEYHDSPNMPVLQWYPAARVRRSLGVPEPVS